MSFLNPYKFKHFFYNKYVLSLFKRKRYFISYHYKYKALWFRTYKVASRTIDDMLKRQDEVGSYIYASDMAYSPSMFKDYFKFAFVRNPETRFVSAWKDKVLRQNYFHFSDKEHEKMKDLDHFINWVKSLDIENCDEHLRCQMSLVDVENMDFIGKFENFEVDFNHVVSKLKVPNYKMEFLNQGMKKEFELSDNQRKEIRNIYHMDFKEFYPEMGNI